MSAAEHLLKPWYWLAGKILGLWARPVVQPDDPAQLLEGSAAPVCYVLETGGLADTLALERLCRIHGLPSPLQGLDVEGASEARRIVVLRRMRGFIFRRTSPKGSGRLRRLVEASPVRSCCWSRSASTGGARPSANIPG